VEISYPSFRKGGPKIKETFAATTGEKTLEKRADQAPQEKSTGGRSKASKGPALVMRGRKRKNANPGGGRGLWLFWRESVGRKKRLNPKNEKENGAARRGGLGGAPWGR